MANLKRSLRALRSMAIVGGIAATAVPLSAGFLNPCSAKPRNPCARRAAGFATFSAQLDAALATARKASGHRPRHRRPGLRALTRTNAPRGPPCFPGSWNRAC